MHLGRFAPSIFHLGLMTSSGGWPRTDPSIPLIWSSLGILHAHKVGSRADTFSFRCKEEVDAGRFLLPRRRAISELPFAAAHMRRARQLAGEVVGFFAKTLGDGHVEPPRHICFQLPRASLTKKASRCTCRRDLPMR